MNSYLLRFDESILQLEFDHQWETACDVLFQRWKQEPHNLNNFICAGAELWYTLLLKDYYQNAPTIPVNLSFKNPRLLQERLTTLLKYGFYAFKDSPEFNVYYGYMIKVMPYFFLTFNGNYDEWQQKGRSMIVYAYELAMNEPFVKAMYYELKYDEDFQGFCDACRSLWNVILPNEWGKSGVQEYFRAILQGGQGD